MGVGGQGRRGQVRAGVAWGWAGREGNGQGRMGDGSGKGTRKDLGRLHRWQIGT